MKEQTSNFDDVKRARRGERRGGAQPLSRLIEDELRKILSGVPSDRLEKLLALLFTHLPELIASRISQSLPQKTRPQPPVFISLREISETLRISRQTARRTMERWGVKAAILHDGRNGTLRYPREDFERAMAKNREP